MTLFHFVSSSFAWLELVSHKSFMPKLLSLNGHKGWPYFQSLLVGLFQFLEPLLGDAERRRSVCAFFCCFIFERRWRIMMVLFCFCRFICYTKAHWKYCWCCVMTTRSFFVVIISLSAIWFLQGAYKCATLYSVLIRETRGYQIRLRQTLRFKKYSW